MEEIEVPIKYYSINESEIGYTTQDLPEGSTEISYDTYTSILTQFEENTLAAQQPESS